MTDLMQHVLQLAAKGRYRVQPNPMVGAIIVQGGEIVGEGYHEMCGGPHAEINALRQAEERAKAATLYINLEPCCHYGRTPPCVDAIIAAGIKEVHIACVDPNPFVAGQGIATLQAANIRVRVGEAEQEARALNRIFFHYITTKMPYVIAKWAMSLDGKIQVAEGDERSLSNHLSHEKTHEIRQAVGAILVGANTIRQDNPRLTVRLPDAIHQPLRVILQAIPDLDPHAHVFSPDLPCRTLLVCAENQIERAQQIYPAVEVLGLSCDAKGIKLPTLLAELGRRNIASVLVEGGKRVLESFLNANLVQELNVILTPWVLAQLPYKQAWDLQESACLEQDFYLGYRIK